MDLGSLQNAIQRRPFQPFDICLADGRSIGIRHPEALAIGNRVAIAMIPEESSDKWIVIEPLLIVTLEFDHQPQSV
jgi:hypothetical protein